MRMTKETKGSIKDRRFFCLLVFLLFSLQCSNVIDRLIEKTEKIGPSFDVAVWRAGSFQGNFGFERCPNQLFSQDPSKDGERIGEHLRLSGFQRAVFFGASPVQRLSTMPQVLSGAGGPDISDWSVGLISIDSNGEFSWQSDFGGDTLRMLDLSRLTPAAGGFVFTNPTVDELLVAAGSWKQPRHILEFYNRRNRRQLHYWQ